MRWRLFLLILFSLTGHLIGNGLDSLRSDKSAQISDDLIKVDSIRITGNEITDADIILRELTFKTGDIIRQKDLDYNRERVYSLSLFTNVKVYPELSDISTVVIAVKESWYIWPIPFIDIKDNALNKATYGLYIAYSNFRGRNETLEANFGFGYDPMFSLSYICPWLIRDQGIFFSSSIYYRNSANKSNLAQILYDGQFNQKIYSGAVSIGKRINLFNSASVTFGFDYIETPRYVQPMIIQTEIPQEGRISASDGRIDRTLKLGLSYSFDTRNLRQFPDSGLYTNISYTYKGFKINKIDYSVLSFDVRHYVRLLGDLSAKWRFASRFTFGERIPLYDYSILGYGDKVRGHFNEIKEGNHSYLGSIELKYPILKEWDFSIKLPVVPGELTSYRIGIYPYLFADAGGTQIKGHKISAGDFYSGYGAGLIFLFLPYNIFRVEMALDEYMNKEFIFGFGFSF